MALCIPSRAGITGWAIAFLVGVLSCCSTSLQAAEPASPSDVRQGPQRVVPGEHGIGRYVADCSFQDLSGETHRLSDFRKKKLTVIGMTSTSCPLSKKYLPTWEKLSKEYAAKEVAFLLVNPVSVDDASAMQTAQAQLDKQALYIPDGEQKLATAMGATTTTDVIVLNADRTIVYHGAIDDQYGFGYALDAPRRTLLIDALEALLAGLPPAVTATDAPGCLLDVAEDANAKGDADVTWHNRIGRIVERHCVECHRTGGVAPFTLEKPEEVIAHQAMIRQVIDRGVMPPWFAAKAEEGHVSPWSNERSLSAAEKGDLFAWLGSKDHALGDPKDAAQPRTFPEGWSIGQPDVVFGFAEPVKVKPTGTMPYQNVIIETNLPEDRWVQSIEVRPGARDVVHHVVVSIAGSTLEDGDERDSAAEERRGFWALYVPGSSTLSYPAGYAKRLPRGAKLRFQMHYTPNGTATEDVTQIGMVFAKEPPQREVRVIGIVNPRLNIPAGADNHQEEATLQIPANAELLAFLPHMHLRGKACRYELVSRQGETRTLLDVPRYDFNWQLLYRFAEPRPVSAGDTLRFTAWFDNSEGNPANPDPTKNVRWGPQTSDEMHLGYVEYVLPGVKPGTLPAQGALAERIRAAVAERTIFGLEIGVLFQRIDQDGDASLSKEEFTAAAQTAPKLKDKPAAQEALFLMLDADKSDDLSSSEFEKLLDIVRQNR